MKIPQKLPQFEKEKALIVVTGKQEGKFLLCCKGTIKKLKSFRFYKPHYSDREGYFKRRGKTGIYGSGSVYEPKKERIKIELVNRLEKNIKSVLAGNKVDTIYLVCPDYLKNRVKEAFPPSAKKKLSLSLLGNYCHWRPLDLLKKLNTKFSFKKKPTVPTKESAAKLLRKSKKARKVIKGKP